MKFSIITPSFEGAGWLPLCLASVADQAVQLEHIVQDAGSTDGTQELLSRHSGIRAFIEKDDGMYDAINRGLRRAGGDIVAYLNSDEQYLPGALAQVEACFAENPAVDIVFGGFVVTRADGSYICSRKVLAPHALHTRICHLSAFTCGLFFRRRIIERFGLYFDPSYRQLGDAEWVLRAIASGAKMARLEAFTSVFTDTGENLGLRASARAERERLLRTAPLWQQKLAPLVALQHRLRRFLAGIYFQRPFVYEIYTRSSSSKREHFAVERPTTVWKDRLTLLR